MATMDVNVNPTNNNNKRKRGPDQDAGRNAKIQNTNGEQDAYSALLQGLDPTGAEDDSTRTAQAALAAPMNQSAYPEPPAFDGAAALSSAFDESDSSALPNLGSAQALIDARGNQGNKPAVGTQEWHQQRKDNHKEVERRRREVINEGIENIAKIVPGTEKNKGAILQRTCQYITELQNEKASHLNERATFDVALKELTNRLDRMKESARTAWAESNKWQQRCRDAGLHFDDYDESTLAGLEDEELDPNTVVS
ncbi:hypothetical protein EDD36DRAFT_270153 [Exophiala viscosa]|uniref:BHLH domain-containing protein n=1 Tax=Exophiala viscosa TaxID=2486360 RepID=A0AAN6DTJ1_9EURO|nr:hypothetical protein EDD36DRAFT_270153 [Exophiala viscosa]